jgi:dihydroflavonol-4-reductase
LSLNKVLVTGGTGLLGANLTRALVALGYEVNVFYRAGEKHPFLEGLKIQHFTGDITDEQALSAAMEGCEVVFHTVGNMSFWKADRPIQYKVNVLGTKTALHSAVKAGVRRFIHTSTINTLGIPAHRKIGDETTEYNWQQYDFYYSTTKKEAEELALAANSPEFEVVVVNPGTIFGAGDIHLNAGTYIKAIHQKQGFFASSGGTNCVGVNDVVNGHILAMQKGQPGERYILGGENLTYKKLFEMIGKELELPFHPVLALPDAVTMAAAQLSEWYFKWVGGKNNFVPESAKVGGLKLFYNSSKAKQELGYQSRSVQIAIREAIAFYRNQKMI